MNQNLIFWPMMVQAIMSIWVYIPMGRARISSVKSGKASAYDFKLPKQNEPGEIAHLGNAVSNQFELPVLFFVVCLATHSAGLVDGPMLVAAWFFAILKAVHSTIHITSNKLKYRFRLFSASLFVVLAMWIWFAIRLVAA